MKGKLIPQRKTWWKRKTSMIKYIHQISSISRGYWKFIAFLDNSNRPPKDEWYQGNKLTQDFIQQIEQDFPHPFTTENPTPLQNTCTFPLNQSINLKNYQCKEIFKENESLLSEIQLEHKKAEQIVDKIIWPEQQLTPKSLRPMLSMKPRDWKRYKDLLHLTIRPPLSKNLGK